jgi:hypothetical protein
MLGLDQNIIIANDVLSTEYKKTTSITMSRFEKLDFFIYILDDDNGNINTLDFILECAASKEPTEADWARISYEVFDQQSETFLLKDYVIRKTITEPSTIAIRCRSQGIYMRIGIKANANGGLYSIGTTKKTLQS